MSLSIKHIERALEWAIRQTVPMDIAPDIHVRQDPRVPVGVVTIMIVMNGTEERFAPLPPELAPPKLSPDEVEPGEWITNPHINRWRVLEGCLCDNCKRERKRNEK